MKVRLIIGCILTTIVAVFANIAYRYVQTANVAAAFEQAVVNRDFAKADEMVWSLRDIELAKLSAVSPKLEVNMSFQEQTPLDCVLGQTKGRILIERRCERFVEMYEVDVVASASGVEVTRNAASRSDYPTIEESVAEWASAIGVTVGSLTAVVSNGH